MSQSKDDTKIANVRNMIQASLRDSAFRLDGSELGRKYRYLRDHPELWELNTYPILQAEELDDH